MTIHPKALKNAVPGHPVTFTVHATGTEPIKYQWQWKPAGEEGGGSEEWQQCDIKWCSGNALSVPNVQKLNEGSYQCVISNCAGFQITKAAKLSVGTNLDINIVVVVVVVVCFCCWLLLVVVDVVVVVVAAAAVVVLWVLAKFCFLFIPTADPPRITTHPQGLRDVVPGQSVAFTIQAEGTEPLNYKWQQKPRGGSEVWQVCDVERFPGADSSTLTIPSVEKSNEGSYHCTVSNCANSDTSDSALLTLGELK